MYYLIYELFSGVGFCNQLFSLETGIYLANLLKRKLILIIKYPLCHCGGSSWKYGKFLDYFDQNMLNEIIKQGYEVFYSHQNIPSYITEIICDQDKCDLFDVPNKFSHIGFVDIDLNVQQNFNDIQHFLRCRTKFVFDKNVYKKDYIYTNQSNAARCFTTFYTTHENYTAMTRICQSLTQLNPYLENLMSKIKFEKNNSLAVHFRFGDKKHSSEYIDTQSLGKYERFLSQLKRLNIENGNIYVMCDRKDSTFLKKIQQNHTIIFISDIISDILPIEHNNTEIIQFLMEMSVCKRCHIFIGYEGSTVSHYIHFLHHLKGCKKYEYTERTIYQKKPYSWIHHNVFGASLTWKVFFPDNIVGTFPTLITLTNDGYMQFTENLLLSLKPIGLESKLKIYCIGTKSFNFFKNNYPNNEIININSEKAMTDFVEYKSLQNKDIIGKMKWAKITSYKIHVIHLELIKGNDVIFTDGDIVFHKNPIPYLLDNIEDYELLIQNDETEGKKMCSGFFLMKSNENTIKLTDINNIDMKDFSNDQKYLRSVKTNHKFLPLELFPNGLYFRQKSPEYPYIVHFNYDVGLQKINRMRKYNVWYLDQTKISDYNQFSSKLNKFLVSKHIIVRQGFLTDDFNCFATFDEELRSILISEKKNFCRNILQIGFLAGHSAEYFLNLNKLVKVTSIDIGKLQSVKVGNDFINDNYPERTNLIIDHSNSALKTLINEKPNKIYDIILIDGSFEYQDIKNDIEFCKHLSDKNTIVIVFNVIKNDKLNKYWTKGFSQVWSEAIADNLITKISQFDIKVGRGFAFCKYTK